MNKLLLIVILLSLPFSCSAVIINEICWMGTTISFNDEWIELYNDSNEDIDLIGWKITSDNLDIELEGIIPAKGFFILERTDDDTLPNITADLIYKGNLNNKGEHLKLIKDNVIDEITEWLAGDNTTKQTMERIGLTWQTSKNPGGTPRAENSSMQEPVQQTTEEESVQQTYPSNILINEILPSPEGPDAENEWVEIYNANGFEVDLTGWTIQDSVGKTTIYTFSQTIKDYLVIYRPETKITLNNSGDTIVLMNPNKETIDTITFDQAPINQSFIRDQWTATLTPGKQNIAYIEPEQETDFKQEPEPEQQPDIKTDISETSKNNNLLIFFIAFIIALLSALIVLFLKKRIEN